MPTVMSRRAAARTGVLRRLHRGSWIFLVVVSVVRAATLLGSGLGDLNFRQRVSVSTRPIGMCATGAEDVAQQHAGCGDTRDELWNYPVHHDGVMLSGLRRQGQLRLFEASTLGYHHRGWYVRQNEPGRPGG